MQQLYTMLCTNHIGIIFKIWTDIFSLHHDPKLWEDPWEFVPDRFLDENRELVPVDHPLRKQ